MDPIFSFFKDLIPWKKIQEFLGQLYSHQPFALSAAILLLVISLVLGGFYLHRSSEYDEIVRNTLSSNMEATPQSFKGLEAFIFSTLKQTSDVDVSNELRREYLHTEFYKACEELQQRLDSYQSEREKRVAEVKVKVAKGKNEGKILTDATKPGFLFLPINVLRASFPPSDLDKLRDDGLDDEKKAEVVNPILARDTELKEDIALTGFIANNLHKLTSTPIVEPKSQRLRDLLKNTPAQVYIITKNGINRIFNNQLKDPELYYGTQFPATTFFPSRPYFWPTFLNEDTEDDVKHKHFGDRIVPTGVEKTVGKYFYVTRPYLDLAGNGIVITLTRGLYIGGTLQAVLCFDLPYVTAGNNVYEILKKGVQRYEGQIVPVVCTTTPETEIKCSKDDVVDRSPVSSSESALLNEIEQYIRARSIPRERSEIAGNLQVLPTASNTDSMHISVPIAAEISDKQQKAKLALINIDFIRYKKITAFFAGASSFSFAVMIILLTYLWGATVRSKKEYQEAFSQVAKVMYRSPTPYVRLDSHDRIVDCSLSFCGKLGYPPNANSVKQIRNQTFGSLCADEESIDQYETVQRSRAAGERVKPYPLKLRGKDDLIVPVIVSSAAVPSPSRGLFPETFGIILDQDGALQHANPPSGQEQHNLRMFRRS
jgi:hypothetical protein